MFRYHQTDSTWQHEKCAELGLTFHSEIHTEKGVEGVHLHRPDLTTVVRIVGVEPLTKHGNHVFLITLILESLKMLHKNLYTLFMCMVTILKLLHLSSLNSWSAISILSNDRNAILNHTIPQFILLLCANNQPQSVCISHVYVICCFLHSLHGLSE